MASSLEIENGTPKVLDRDRKEEEEEFSHAMQLVMSTVMSMSLQTAIELGVFNIIAKADEGAKLSSAEIVDQIDDSAGSNVRRLYSLCPGVEHVGGDMFESVPHGDAILMKWILHDWSDGHCLKILRNCYVAIPDHGNVKVVEAILPITSENSFAARSTFAFDVAMMAPNPGGKERSQQEFLALETGAGFSGIKFVCCVCNHWIMEFYK
ncbi:hypothetical protein TIFTF001_011980 [Ficus carica]|uniref:O-methyltransferase C-terminal domain-containing protein n=1 Tax=Ficus carica TaxID=3494 RepID=A0AA87ZSP8_FICCA|nr:hypothetical protein TIFTF001_011980 [Ficus carica]